MVSYKVVVILSQILYCAKSQDLRRPFLAADKGNYPKCQIYGRTYCLQTDDYPKDTIKYLLENHLFDLKSLMLSEGIPVSDFGDNEKPKFQQVESFSNSSDEVSFFINEPILNLDNDPRSKRRDNFRHPSFSSSQNKIIDQEEKQARTDMDLNSNRKKNGYELLFRAGQSDTDPISLEDLDNQSLEKIMPQALEVQKYPDSEADLKKSLFEELKSLDDGSFGHQDSLFSELLAATVKTPKDSGQAVSMQIVDDNHEEDEEDDEDDMEDEDDEVVETPDLVFVNHKGNFIPEVSSVQYEAPKPSKGYNFNNFKSPEGDQDEENTFSVGDRPAVKRENPQGAKNEIDLGSSLDFSYSNPSQQDFPSFFNSDEIDKEVAEYQQSVATGGAIRISAGNPPPIVTTAVPSLESGQHNRNVLIGKLHQDKQVLELNEMRKAQANEGRIFDEEIEIPLEDPIKVHETQSRVDRFSSEEIEKFLSSAPGTNVDDLLAFHDQLDRLINGDNQKGPFKNPSSISFDTVDRDDDLDDVESNRQVTAAPTVTPFTPITVTVRPHSVPTVETRDSESLVLLGGFQTHEKKLPERSIRFDDKPETSFNNFVSIDTKQAGILDLGSETESRTESFYGSNDAKPTQVDVVIVETGNQEKTSTENSVKFFDYLYRNLKEVEPPKDLGITRNPPPVPPSTPGPLYHKPGKVKPTRSYNMPKKDVQPRTKNSDLFASNEAESVGHVLLKPTLEFPTKEVFPMERSEANTGKFSLILDESFNPPDAEYDFKPILNPPPEFFELRPVLKNLFQKEKKEDKIEPTSDDVVGATTQLALETTVSPSAEYSDEDFNNYTDAPTNEGGNPEVPDASNESHLKDHQHQPLQVDQRHRRKILSPGNTGIYSALQKVTDVLDSFFSNGLRKTRFGRSGRSKRQVEPLGSSMEVCPTRKHFIHPVVAYSVKGQWMYVVNLPGNESHQQGIVTEECMTSKCNNVCTNDPKLEATCQPRFVQKRLVALHPNGDKLTSELFWFPATCSCKIKKI